MSTPFLVVWMIVSNEVLPFEASICNNPLLQVFLPLKRRGLYLKVDGSEPGSSPNVIHFIVDAGLEAVPVGENHYVRAECVSVIVSSACDLLRVVYDSRAVSSSGNNSVSLIKLIPSRWCLPGACCAIAVLLSPYLCRSFDGHCQPLDMIPLAKVGPVQERRRGRCEPVGLRGARRSVGVPRSRAAHIIRPGAFLSSPRAPVRGVEPRTIGSETAGPFDCPVWGGVHLLGGPSWGAFRCPSADAGFMEAPSTSRSATAHRSPALDHGKKWS